MTTGKAGFDRLNSRAHDTALYPESPECSTITTSGETPSHRESALWRRGCVSTLKRLAFRKGMIPANVAGQATKKRTFGLLIGLAPKLTLAGQGCETIIVSDEEYTFIALKLSDFQKPRVCPGILLVKYPISIKTLGGPQTPFFSMRPVHLQPGSARQPRRRSGRTRRSARSQPY